MLYIVATPIGNLGDMTFRAVETLKNVSVIAAEDTRHSGKLMKHYGIETRRVSYSDKNKKRATPKLIEHMKEGNSVALISDAGTPGISDPGYYLIREAIKEGIHISPIPGASALLSALVPSGCATDSFQFIGFLPKTESKKKSLFNSFKKCDHTIVCYESRYRIRKTLEIVGVVLPEQHLCVARELTKLHEEFLRGTAAEILRALSSNPKGEYVMVFAK